MIKECSTVYDVRHNSNESGGFFFSPGAMRFFDSRLLSGYFKRKPVGDEIEAGYFVTSERYAYSGMPRTYTVREYIRFPRKGEEDGVDIRTVDEFYQMSTPAAAKRAAKKLAEDSWL